jgi:hypothetical protein
VGEFIAQEINFPFIDISNGAGRNSLRRCAGKLFLCPVGNRGEIEKCLNKTKRGNSLSASEPIIFRRGINPIRCYHHKTR